MQLFACPYESSRCGVGPQIYVGNEKVIQSKGFDTGDVCYYWIGAMPNTAQGDYIYVNFVALSDIEAFVTIKNAIDEKQNDVTCKVSSGDTILIQHPNKLYMSFKAQDFDSKFFINA